VAADLAGDYLLQGGMLVRIRSGERTLALQMTARAPVRLQAFAPDRYTDAEGSCEVTFQRSSKGAVTGLILTLAGIDRTASRVLWTVPAIQ